MANDRKAFSVRMEPINYDKLNTLARRNKRSMAMELEYIVEQYFEGYESQYGQITPDAKGGISNQQVGNNISFVNSK